MSKRSVMALTSPGAFPLRDRADVRHHELRFSKNEDVPASDARAFS